MSFFRRLDDNQKIAAQLMDELQSQAPKAYEFRTIAALEPVKKLMEAPPEVQIAFIRTTVDTAADLRRKLGAPDRKNAGSYMNLRNIDGFPQSSILAVRQLLRRSLPLTGADLLFVVRRTADLDMISTWSVPYLEAMISFIERYLAKNPPSEDLSQELLRLQKALTWTANAAENKLVMKISRLIKGPDLIPLQPGEAWSDQALADIHGMPAEQRETWIDLLAHCQNSGSSKPSQKWITTAKALVEKMGQDDVMKKMLAWFPLVEKPRTQPVEPRYQGSLDPNWLIIDLHADIIRGLVWVCGLFESSDVARSLAVLALSAYKKLPGVGPRAVKIGNACIYSLGEMPGSNGLAQLAILKVKVRFRTALKGIDAALASTARRLGVPADELEEISVPTYGLADGGILHEAMGDYDAELRIEDFHAEVTWKNKSGKVLRSAPSAVKQQYGDELKELNAAAKDIQAMLSAQRDRIDNLFIQQKTWPYEVWCERYRDHPLMGTLARCLIWRFTAGDRVADSVFVNGTWVDVQGKPVDLPHDAVVSLWHPIGNPIETIVAWRQLLENHAVRQPFKQAHREVYLLTDAELRTQVYSNRYAGHVVKQHQFNSLCAVRGWRNVLKLLVDQDFPPASLSLPKWNLRAEFWTDGAGDNYGVDTNDTGTFHRLTTDQVRFFPIDAPQSRGHASERGQQRTVDPIPLAEIPPLVFSEVMRDIDLFVGVASVGNDPTWSDGGPDGRYREYWQNYSFGELSATARTRKDILQRLIPRLKIAGRCSFEEKFLVVRGDIRTYKIHLGSGNILMTPNDQYLCIVQGRSASAPGEKLYLPFEGDAVLSIIISKALLLADDARITDTTIANQIKPK